MVSMPAPAPSPLRRSLHEVIFEARTPAGRAFDVALILVILASVGIILLESVPGVDQRFAGPFYWLEWGFTLLFTLEYMLRLWVVARPGRYARSFFGVVDLLAVLPMYLSILFPGAQIFLVIRLVRILRVFHVFNLAGYQGAADTLGSALRATRFTLTVFFVGLVSLVVFLGALMYLVEGSDSGFTSIPVSIYWAVVTVTTLGYGDLVPQTALGRGLTTAIVLLGYWALAIPVAVVSVELSRATMMPRRKGGPYSPGPAPPPCPSCGTEGHQADARHCRLCGETLPSPGSSLESPPPAPPKPPAAPSSPSR
jgi:voltage-gated potassium channel